MIFTDLLIFLLSWVIPKCDKTITFCSTDTEILRGNIKELYNYCLNQGYLCAVLSRGRVVRKECMKELVDAYASDDIQSSGPKHLSTEKKGGILSRFQLPEYVQFIWVSVRSRVVFMDHNLSTLFWSGHLQAWSRIHVIQIWHGTGFKQIGIPGMKKPSSLIDKFRQFNKKARMKSYRYITTSSESDSKKKRVSFRNQNVVITGNPKADRVLLGNKNGFRTKLEGKIILFAPTFRDTGTYIPFTNSFWQILETLLEQENGFLLIRKHPKDRSVYPIPAGSKRILDLSDESTTTEQILSETDILITDYSSVATDFVITSRQIIFYMPDLEKYREQCRDFYYPFPDILPGPFIYSEDELLEFLFQDDWFKTPEYQHKYNQFVETFHAYKDGNSCERIMALARNL